MAHGRKGPLALFMGNTGSSYLPQEMVHGLHQGMNTKDGRHLLVTIMDDEQLAADQPLPALLGEVMADGILVNFQYNFPAHFSAAIRNYKIPSVWVNSKAKHDAVYFSEEAAGYQLTKHFIDLGHKHIVYLDSVLSRDPKLSHYSTADRAAGYERAMKEAGYPICFGPDREIDLVDQIKLWIASSDANANGDHYL